MFEVRALGSVKVSGDEVVKLHSIVQALTPHPSYTYIVLQALCARICGAYSNGVALSSIIAACFSNRQILGTTSTIGASIITNTIVGVSYYKYSIIGPKTLF